MGRKGKKGEERGRKGKEGRKDGRKAGRQADILIYPCWRSMAG